MVTELLKHLFPRRVLESNLRVRYTFGLGGLTLVALLVLVGSGVLLLFYYSPSPEHAHASIQFIDADVWGGAFLRSLHRLASHALLLLLALHALRVILTGAFRRPRRLNWIVGCSLLFLAVFEAYTGYLLPADQLAYWATQTGMELLRALPGGSAARTLLVPDAVAGPLSLLRFYALHVAVVPLCLLSLSMLHFFVIRRQRGLLPYQGGSVYVNSAPRFFTLVKRATFLGLMALVVLAFLLPAPLGLPADPAHPPNPAKSAWFLVWIQELVSYGTRAIYAVVALAAAFVALPWLPIRRIERASWFPREQRAVAVTVLLVCGWVLMLTAVGLFFRGPNWQLVSPF